MRIGDTVRRPVGPHTDAVDALLTHLWEVGFTGAPRPLGRDERGRQVLEFVPGESPMDIDPRDLPDIGRMLRDLHAATASFTPPPDAGWHTEIPPVGVPGAPVGEVICHHDAAPWNLVRAERGWVLIDWDNAGPGSRAWELAYSALSCCGMRPEQPVPESAARLRSFVDAYGSRTRPAAGAGGSVRCQRPRHVRPARDRGPRRPATMGPDLHRGRPVLARRRGLPRPQRDAWASALGEE